MRLLLLNIFMICGVTLAMPGGSTEDDDVNLSVHSSMQNGNVVTISRRRMNGQDKEIVDVSAFHIRIDGDNFDCGSSLKCPKETYKCHITSEAILSDPRKMKTVAECQDKEGNVLQKNEYNEANPHPEAQPPFSRVASVARDGNIEIEDSTGNHQIFGTSKPMTKEQQEQFDRSMRRMNVQLREQGENFNRQMEAFNQNMAHNMNQMQQQMSQSFGKNFPFGNSNPFGANFPFGNSNPFTHFQSFNPFANFHTFFYPPTNNNFNDYVSEEYNYPSNTFVSNDYYQPESHESRFSVEEFKPVQNNYRPIVSSAPNRFDKYRYAY